mmetsp:Transcript_29875/g.5398  ORF Transcript_29875/g.5398 Transcript_29875/m.5398 type:complete len:80 (+) Transcript_29875:166-405(+)
MINIAANDLELFEFVGFTCWIIAAPIMSIFVLGILYWKMSYAGVIGFFIIIGFSPLMVLLSKIGKSMRGRLGKLTDERT